MKFYVIDSIADIKEEVGLSIYLVKDSWNDWWEYYTLFQVYINDSDTYIGSVKIGSKKMVDKSPPLENDFEDLDESFFSLGQSENYYTNLNKLGDNNRIRILNALNDIAFKVEVFEEVKGKRIVRDSLMRDISYTSVTGRLRRLAHGDATLTKYNFVYNYNEGSELKLGFKVTPNSFPPTNMHVLIGRNGVGKSYLLNTMLDSIVRNDMDKGYFTDLNKTLSGTSIFANVVSVSFSAFDDYQPILDSKTLTYTYLGLKQLQKEKESKINMPPKSPKKLTAEFAQSIYKCNVGGKADLWSELVKDLSYDPSFDRAELVNLLSRQSVQCSEENLKKEAVSIFNRLSSGHKIVLLTLTRLVETVEEKTLVVLDEPETYLHPPLLSAFIQVISKLLRKRNGVAIIATHSPVILQEVPKSCVWKIRREGKYLSFSRPNIETFAENLGVLTREVFGLEVTQTGFHQMIRKVANEIDSYEEVLEYFNHELGDEGKNLVMTLVSDDEGDFEE